MAERTNLQKLIARKHMLEDMIQIIVDRPRRLTPQVKQLLQGYRDELVEVRQAIGLERGRAL